MSHNPFIDPWPRVLDKGLEDFMMAGYDRREKAAAHRKVIEDAWTDEADAWNILHTHFKDWTQLEALVIVQPPISFIRCEMPSTSMYLGEFRFRRRSLTSPWELVSSR
ncbi:MAG: hypothetical protein V4621_08235 [Pseudomonadota bacterium]